MRVGHGIVVHHPGVIESRDYDCVSPLVPFSALLREPLVPVTLWLLVGNAQGKPPFLAAAYLGLDLYVRSSIFVIFGRAVHLPQGPTPL